MPEVSLLQLQEVTRTLAVPVGQAGLSTNSPPLEGQDNKSTDSGVRLGWVPGPFGPQLAEWP